MIGMRGMEGSAAVQEVEPAEPRPEVEVEQDRVHGLAPHHVEAHAPVVCPARCVAALRERSLEHLPIVRVVVDDEDVHSVSVKAAVPALPADAAHEHRQAARRVRAVVLAAHSEDGVAHAARGRAVVVEGVLAALAARAAAHDRRPVRVVLAARGRTGGELHLVHGRSGRLP
ncbi:MAG TPA: hypothetical protein VK714_06345 [Myxococcota bacterium]|nr:hypothetical protein [Myxococcota bacterium]